MEHRDQRDGGGTKVIEITNLGAELTLEPALSWGGGANREGD